MCVCVCVCGVCVGVHVLVCVCVCAHVLVCAGRGGTTYILYFVHVCTIQYSGPFLFQNTPHPRFHNYSDVPLVRSLYSSHEQVL